MKRVPSVGCLDGAAAVRPAYPGARLVRRAKDNAAAWSSYVKVSSVVATVSTPVKLGSTVVRSLSKHSLKVLNAVAMTNTAALPSDANLSVDLDWRPVLSASQEVVCWSCAAITACVVYLISAPAGASIPYATCIALLFGLVLYTLRNALLEELYKARERIEADLGDPDSRFRHIDNLSVHVKVKASRSLPPPAPTAGAARLAPPSAAAAAGREGPVAAVHCYHGFGSNTWSWSLVQQQLAERLGALVTAHDMPGFGLTQRPTDLSGYYLAFNGRLGRLVMDYELTVRGLLSLAAAATSGEAGYPHTSVLASTDAAAAAAADSDVAAAFDQQAAVVEAIEQESGGSAKEAAVAAVGQGLESPLQATAAAAGEGSVDGVVKGAAAAVADAATSSSNKADAAAAGAANSPSSSSSSSSKQDQQRLKRVLMGHSLGGACAALEYIINPSEYAALVLVAPAIIASLRSNGSSKLEQLQDGTAFSRSLASGEFEQPEDAAAAAHEAAAAARVARSSSSSSSEASSTENDARLADNSSGSSSSSGVGDLSRSESLNAAAAAGDVAFYATRGDDAQFAALLSANGNRSKRSGTFLSSLRSRILALVQTAAMLSVVLLLSVLRPIIVLLLRSLVRSRTFWANTLRQAYYDQSKVTAEAVDAYRMPQLVKGWETGMVQFLLARLGAGGTSSTTSAAAAVGSAPMGGLEDAGLAMRFAAAVAANNTPVLIVHGAGDSLVPASNSFKLAKLLKGCRLAVMKRSGHCPQEEQPELFADIVSSFVACHAAVSSA